MRRIIGFLINAFFVSVAASMFWACTSRNADGTVGDVESTVIHRLDVALASYPSLDVAGRDSVLAEYAGAIDLLFGISGIPVTDSSLIEYAGSRAVQVFEPDIMQNLPSLVNVEQSLGVVAENMSDYQRLSLPEIFGVVSPYNQRIFFGDSLMLVGLNHYLGPDYEGYRSFPQYQRERKHIERLPYDVAEALIASGYPMSRKLTDGTTVLEHMLYQGALMMTELYVVPGATESSVLGYTPEQWDWALSHEGDLWQALIGGNYLYNVSPDIASRLIDEAPSVSFLMSDTPGRIGRFIGLRIVESYMARNPDTDKEYLLSPEFYGDISTLARSGYAPR